MAKEENPWSRSESQNLSQLTPDLTPVTHEQGQLDQQPRPQSGGSLAFLVSTQEGNSFIIFPQEMKPHNEA